MEAAGIENREREIAKPLKDNDFQPYLLFSLPFRLSIQWKPLEGRSNRFHGVRTHRRHMVLEGGFEQFYA